jgi:hypothetical protein
LKQQFAWQIFDLSLRQFFWAKNPNKIAIAGRPYEYAKALPDL